MSCSINSKDYCIVSSIYFISGQFAKLFCQVITKLLILCTRTGIQNKCQKNMGCISVQHKCCLHSMVAVTFLLLASLTSKCADTSDGTASALAIFVCLYQQNLFWYQQDPYIPTGAKLYLQNPKGTHTVYIVCQFHRCLSFVKTSQVIIDYVIELLIYEYSGLSPRKVKIVGVPSWAV